MTDSNTSSSNIRRNIIALISAVTAGIALLLVMALPAAGLLMLIRESNRTGYILFLSVILLIIAGFMSGKIAVSLSSIRGWLCGAVVSVLIFLALGLLSAIVGGGSFLSGWALVIGGILFVSSIAGAAAGAIKR